MTDRLYLTTAIPFVNGAPHLGHALEYVQTDVLARHARARGRSVRFLTGTDEHAAKNVHAAGAAGEDVVPFVARNAAGFRALADALEVSYDDFLRTSADERHRPAVEEIWRRCADAGDLYRREYVGWYCAGCEEFYDRDSLPGGRCAEHDTELVRVEEENWFFRLSRYRAALIESIASGSLRIEPAARRNEVLGFLAGAVRDISVSRPRARVHDWGIPVPGDPDQIVYVWFDALTNYISALGYGSDDASYREWWPGAGERTHVIGKGIVRFHAVIWPAILCSAGQPLPTTLLVHDYVTANGRKIGKSLGNAVDPSALIERYGVDALRWWLAREVPRIGEADFTEQRLLECADRDLANGVGNLVQRVVTLAAKAFGGDPIEADAAPSELSAKCDATRAQIDAALAGLDLRGATEALVALIDVTNRYVESTRPWELVRDERDREPARAVLAPLVRTIRAIAAELAPFVPALATRVRERVGGEGQPVAPGPAVQPQLA